MTHPRLQPMVRARLATLGATGERWHAELTATLNDLCRRWDLVLGRPLPGGSAAYVVRAMRGDEPCVLKVLVPDPEIGDGATVLAAARGRGYVRLLEDDPRRRVLLMEELGPSMERRGLDPAEALVSLAATLRLAWQVPLETVPAPAPGEDKASSLHRMIGELDRRLGHPCAPGVVALALQYAERRAAARDVGREVVVHGDPHPSNALVAPAGREGGETGWLFVDPEGFRCSPAYDLGVALRDWTSRLRGPDPRAVLEGYAEILAAASGLDAEEIWEWGYLERVSTGLYVTSFGATAVGRPFLESAARLLHGG